jgi:hypothetical protein
LSIGALSPDAGDANLAEAPDGFKADFAGRSAPMNL